MDLVTGKWEERVRTENEDMPPPPPPKSPMKAFSVLPDISENGSRSKEIYEAWGGPQHKGYGMDTRCLRSPSE